MMTLCQSATYSAPSAPKMASAGRKFLSPLISRPAEVSSTTEPSAWVTLTLSGAPEGSPQTVPAAASRARRYCLMPRKPITLQIRKSPCIASGKWVEDTISQAATGRTSFLSSSNILKPCSCGRTWNARPPVPSVA